MKLIIKDHNPEAVTLSAALQDRTAQTIIGYRTQAGPAVLTYLDAFGRNHGFVYLADPLARPFHVGPTPERSIELALMAGRPVALYDSLEELLGKVAPDTGTPDEFWSNVAQKKVWPFGMGSPVGPTSRELLEAIREERRPTVAPKPPPFECWVNVYPSRAGHDAFGSAYHTKKAAIEGATSGSIRTAHMVEVTSEVPAMPENIAYLKMGEELDAERRNHKATSDAHTKAIGRVTLLEDVIRQLVQGHIKFTVSAKHKWIARTPETLLRHLNIKP